MNLDFNLIFGFIFYNSEGELKRLVKKVDLIWLNMLAAQSTNATVQKFRPLQNSIENNYATAL